ncbi:MAG: hypothetical protein E7668_07280 [Ruminococcaceae bacterium]|nr:hypothetical protein [Oscillospiraceae bacterium]
MAKTYTWEIKEDTVNEETEEAMEVLHKVELKCSMLTGKAIVTIDGTEFDISTRPFGLRGTNQMFRLGELPAILDFPKSGEPDIVIDGVCVRSGKAYQA